MGAHAFLAPSSAFRWVRCALAPTLEAAYPETEPSPASLEGTAAHWVGEQLLRDTPAATGDQAPNGVSVTQEMLEGAELVREDIAAHVGLDWRKVTFIEQPVKAKRIHPTDNWGTPDYYAWGQLDGGRLILRIWDYKFGHAIVEAYENWQLINYVAGLIDEVSHDDRAIVVDMAVIQPRAYHRDGPVRHWRVLASDLRPYINRLASAAGAARPTVPEVASAPTATPTPEGCANCRGCHACEALMRASYHFVDQAQEFGALDLTAQALGVELRALGRAIKLMEARQSGLEAEAVARIKRGELVPFWRMESAPGRLAWQKTTGEVLALGQMLGLDLAKPVEPMTPPQAKALAKSRKLPEAIFDAYAARPAGAAKLEPDDGSKARLTFSASNT